MLRLLLGVGAATFLLLVTACQDDAEPQEPEPVAAACGNLKELVVLSWADAAGLVPARARMSTWAEQHPDFDDYADVRTDSGAVDVPRVWRERKADPDAWNALLRYYESVGLPWLHATDLEDLVPVGSSHSSGSDVTGWDRCPPGLNR